MTLRHGSATGRNTFTLDQKVEAASCRLFPKGGSCRPGTIVSENSR
jgi:hypothetical protein